MASSIAQLASRLLSSTVKVESTSRRIRALFDNDYVIDTIRAKYVWEVPYYPQFYVPVDGITKHARLEKTQPVDGTNEQAFAGKLITKNRSTDRVIIFGDKANALSGLVKIEFGALDQWFEELYPMIIHPRNPYARIDILPTDRKIRIEIDGTTVAECNAGVMSLWETGLRVRWYLPKTSLKWEYVTESQSRTGCPYKGWASYYNMTVDGKEHKDVIWWYPAPLIESAAINGMVCFYNEKVDVFVDGVKEGK